MDIVVENVGRRSEKWGEEGTPTAVGEQSLNGYEKDVLFRNLGNGTFADVGYLTGCNRIEDGRGVGLADFDHDGQLDVMLTNFSGPAVLMMGRGSKHHWLQLDLRGRAPNTGAVGAAVKIRTRNGTQSRQVVRGGNFETTSSLIVHFGLGDAAQVDAVDIRWPNGSTQTLTAVKADQRLRVTQE